MLRKWVYGSTPREFGALIVQDGRDLRSIMGLAVYAYVNLVSDEMIAKILDF